MIYYILDSERINDDIYSKSPNTKETVRFNLAGDKFIVKYREEQANMENPLTQEEITEIINNPKNGWEDFDNI